MEVGASSWIILFGLAAVLPLLVYKVASLPAQKFLAGRVTEKNLRIQLGAFSLLAAGTILFVYLWELGANIPGLGALGILVILATMVAAVEQIYRLPTQFTLAIRFAVGVLAFLLGFRFDLAGTWTLLHPLVAQGLDLGLTVLFFAAVVYTISVLDSLRGLAPGVVMVVALTLFTLMLAWARTDVILLPLIIAGMCAGHMLLLGADHRISFGAVGQMFVGVLLAGSTLASRTWGPTLTMLFVPLIACAVPIAERALSLFSRLSTGVEAPPRPAQLHALLLSIGFSSRWVVIFFLILTLQIGVTIHLVYAAKSPVLAVVVGVSLIMLVGFPLACLLKLSERLERRLHPGRLRILYFSHYFYPEVNAPASRLYEHARRWVRQGHQVTVICPVPSAPHGWPYEGYQNALWQEENIDGIRVIRVWTFIAANRRRIRRCINYVSFLGSSLLALFFIRRHDVIVSTSPQFFCGLIGAFAKFYRRERFVLEVRDIWPESIEAVGAGKKRLILNAVGKVAHWMYDQADHIITVGDGYREKLLEVSEVPPDKVSVVYNGIDFERFRLQTKEAPRLFHELGIQDKFVVTYAGTIGMAHGLEAVLKAAELTKDRPEIAWLIVGDGAEKCRLSGLARAKGLSNVHFTGLLPKERIPEILAASGAGLVHLRRTELFKTVMPSKLFEAMALGRPVILGVAGLAARLLREAGAGVAVEPENPVELADAALRLSRDPRQCRAFGTAGQSFVRQYFNRDELAGLFLDVLRRVCVASAVEEGALEAEVPEEERSLPSGSAGIPQLVPGTRSGTHRSRHES